jgi:hypothetical protein
MSTYEECDKLCNNVATLAEKVMQEQSAERAKELIAVCLETRRHLSAVFGNVAEKLGEVVEAATVYTKARVEIWSAEAALMRAIGKMELAVLLHRPSNSQL